MKKILNRLTSILILSLLALVSVKVQAGSAEDEAAASGQKWLALLDGGRFEESWKQSASMFRSEVTLAAWISSLKQSREPMGDESNRSTKRVDFAKTLRGAPDGDYAIIHFTTNFKHREGVVERLTLVKEEGEWKMAAYAIH